MILMMHYVVKIEAEPKKSTKYVEIFSVVVLQDASTGTIEPHNFKLMFRSLLSNGWAVPAHCWIGSENPEHICIEIQHFWNTFYWRPTLLETFMIGIVHIQFFTFCTLLSVVDVLASTRCSSSSMPSWTSWKSYTTGKPLFCSQQTR